MEGTDQKEGMCHFYLLVWGVELDLGRPDVQGLVIVPHGQVGDSAIPPGPEDQFVARVCAVGLIKPEALPVHLKGEGVHEVQQLGRK